MQKRKFILRSLAIRISSICFLLTVVCTLLYAGWVETDRVFNARTILLQQVKKNHGLRLTVEKSDSLENGVLQIEKSEVSLGVHGSGVLEGIRIENKRVVIKNGNLLVFEENPWQWVYGLCGKGQNVQVTIENLFVKTAIGKMHSLGRFEIQSNGNQGLKGSCDRFTIEQIDDSVYVAEGDLFGHIPAFENLTSANFMKVVLPKDAREINGLGYSSFEVTAIQSLLFKVSSPMLLNSLWRDKSIKGFTIIENLTLELQLASESAEMITSGKSDGYVWNGKINKNGEEYRVFVDGEVTLLGILKQGAFSDHYQIPESWLSKLNGLYEFKRDNKNGNLEIRAVSENRSITINEVSP